jgi:hypothetical protein
MPHKVAKDVPEECSDVPASDGESDDGADGAPKSRHKKKRQEIQKDPMAGMSAKAPESITVFECLLLSSPNSSFLWIQYMSFRLQLSEVDKAREIGCRAIGMLRTHNLQLFSPRDSVLTTSNCLFDGRRFFPLTGSTVTRASIIADYNVQSCHQMSARVRPAQWKDRIGCGLILESPTESTTTDFTSAQTSEALTLSSDRNYSRLQLSNAAPTDQLQPHQDKSSSLARVHALAHTILLWYAACKTQKTLYQPTLALKNNLETTKPSAARFDRDIKMQAYQWNTMLHTDLRQPCKLIFGTNLAIAWCISIMTTLYLLASLRGTYKHDNHVNARSPDGSKGGNHIRSKDYYLSVTRRSKHFGCVDRSEGRSPSYDLGAI